MGIRCVWSALGLPGPFECWHNPWSSSRASSGHCLLLRCYDNGGIPFPTKQENGHSSRDEEGELGLFLSCGGTLGVPLDCRRGSRGTSSVSSGVSRTLSGLRGAGGISLETLQRKRASASIEGRISWFFLSYDGDLRDQLMVPQGSPVAMQVGKGP